MAWFTWGEEKGPKQYPNCAVCKWRSVNSYCLIKGVAFCSTNYNTRDCKRLFEPKEESK